MIVANRNFESGDWIDTLDGIGQVLLVKAEYVEEFIFDSVRKGKNIGDVDHISVIYKLLCDYDGKLRKRNKIATANINACDPISKQSKLVLGSIKEKNSDAYKEFIELRYEDRKPILHVFSFNISKDYLYILDEVNRINEGISHPFVFKELNCYLKAEYGLDLLKQEKIEHTECYIDISLINEDFSINERKERLFNKIKIVARNCR